MREYKFRGKEADTGKWVYGFYLKQDTYNLGSKNTKRDLLIKDAGIIVENSKCTSGTIIDKETVGQYTGLKDRNGKEIYEGDIIFDSFYERKAKAVFLEGAFWLDYIDNFKEYETIHKRYQLLANYDNKSVLEVIGNIYDNPDLLEEGE